jgi:VanZ family protein
MTKDISSEKKWGGRVIAYAPLFLWTLVVLGFSTGQASMGETSLIIRPILTFLFPSASDYTIDLYHGYIRKCAHFTEYAILAFFAFRAFIAASTHILRRYRFIAPVIFVAVIASIDEFHQSFVPSRTGSEWDVLLDISGGFFMVVVLWLTRNAKSRPGTIYNKS